MGDPILNRAARKTLIEKMTFERKVEGVESQAGLSRGVFQAKGTSQAKAQGGHVPGYSRNNKTRMAGAE